MKKQILVLMLMVFSGCNNLTASVESALGGLNGNRSLSSIWTSDNSSSSADLTLIKNGAQNIQFDFQDGTSCKCSVTSSVQDSGGSVQVSGCVYSGAPSNDPNCASFAKRFVLSNSGGKLKVCDPSGVCDSYH